MTLINIKLIAFIVNRMSRTEMIEWAAKMPDDTKKAVKEEILKIRSNYWKDNL
jgi:hypothetical protein